MSKSTKKLKIADHLQKHLDTLPKKVFFGREIAEMVSSLAQRLGLPYQSVDSVISDLKNLGLKEMEITSPNYEKTLVRFIWGSEVPIYQLSLSLKSRSFLSHQTAMFIHGFSKETNVVYVNSEQSLKPRSEDELDQQKIDTALQRKARVSRYIFKFREKSICLLNGVHTNNLGVERIRVKDEGELPATNIERTLIDIAVRPIYAGGFAAVDRAYKKANGNISVEKLVSMLKEINYVYPYHQNIGFYMARAGFSKRELDLLRSMGLKFDFYLEHGMNKKNYSKEWKLFYPRSLK